MRIRKFFAVFLLLLSGPAVLLLFSQLNGNLAPLRQVRDRFPVFADVAVDPESNIVAVTDENLFSLRTYDRDLATNDVADPRTVITGNRTRVDFVCGVAVDPVHKEIYTVNNDTAADMLVFNYDASGNVPASRTLRPAPVSTWGVAVDVKNDEVGVTVQQVNKVLIYRRLAEGEEKPLRIIQGPDTGLADPHGIFIDAENNEIFVANHDSYHLAETSQEESTDVQGQLARGIATISVPQAHVQPRASSGKFVDPSITIFSRTAQNNASPVRVIRGPKTELSLPMKVFVDTVHNEIFVANSGSNSILVFSRTASGDVAPIRKIEGSRTKLKKPVGLFVDLKNDEVWATSPEEHSAVVFRRTAQGNSAPLRIVRGAPEGTPAPGIGNPGGIAYDPMREQILVPNWVANPRVAIFARLANGNVAPTRVIEGPHTRLSRTSHAIAFDEKNDEILVPNPLAEAILVYRGNASGDAAPIRTIQGPRTLLQENDELALDNVHDEIIVPTRQAILVFSRTANGNVAPLRVITGPKTKMFRARGIAVDPVNNIIAMGNANPQGILIFNRTDDGDVAPRSIITGPRTGIYALKGFAVLPDRKELIATVEARGVQVSRNVGDSFVGIWNYTDNGDVAPKAMIKGETTMLIAPRGAALDFKHQEIFIIDKVQNSFFTYSWEKILQTIAR